MAARLHAGCLAGSNQGGARRHEATPELVATARRGSSAARADRARAGRTADRPRDRTVSCGVDNAWNSTGAAIVDWPTPTANCCSKCPARSSSRSVCAWRRAPSCTARQGRSDRCVFQAETLQPVPQPDRGGLFDDWLSPRLQVLERDATRSVRHLDRSGTGRVEALGRQFAAPDATRVETRARRARRRSLGRRPVAEDQPRHRLTDATERGTKAARQPVLVGGTLEFEQHPAIGLIADAQAREGVDDETQPLPAFEIVAPEIGFVAVHVLEEHAAARTAQLRLELAVRSRWPLQCPIAAAGQRGAS